VTTDHKPHMKHGKTTRAPFGEFGRLELSILGTPCGNIKKLSEEIIKNLSAFQIAYVDADHKTEETEGSVFLQSGGSAVLTDKISFRRFEMNRNFNKYQRNILFNEYDLTLVNGNHFKAAKQIVVIDEKKPLDKKLEKITDVLMIVLQEGQREVPGYLKDHISSMNDIPICGIEETGKIVEEIEKFVVNHRPELWGLLLAGGKSQRMKKDKGLLEYHGMPHREYLFNQLNKYTSKTFLSCRKDQQAGMNGQFDLITDSFDELGPFGAILSAFRKHPDKAWLVLAVDLPVLSEATIQQLIESRNSSKIATAFYNQETDFPEPLITIWEPKAYPILLNFLALGYSCPRKALINSNIEMIQPKYPNELVNANHPEEYEKMMKIIADKK